MNKQPMAVPANNSSDRTDRPNERLDSWKQIAAYLDKSERTVRRWHEFEGLPVHRHQHRQRGSVWAFRSEIDAWLEQRKNDPASILESAPHRRPSLVLLGVAAAMAGIGAIGSIWLARAPRQTVLLEQIPLTSLHGAEYSPAISPDGRQVAFFWSGSGEPPGIYLKTIDSGTMTPLVAGRNSFNYSPSWSPDGKVIAYLSRNQETETFLCLVSPSGGPSRVLLRLARLKAPGHRFWANSMHLSWTSDSQRIYAPMSDGPGRKGIHLISTRSGEVRPITNPGTGVDYGPTISPDKRSLAFIRVYEQPFSAEEKIYTLKLRPDGSPKGQPRQVFGSPAMISGFVWAPPGDELLFCKSDPTLTPPFDRNMWRLSLDHLADPSPLGIGHCMTIAIHPAGAGRSLLLYGSVRTNNSRLRKAHLANLRKSVAFAPSTGFDAHPAFSPDGKYVAFVSNRSGTAEVWITDAAGGEPRRITEKASVSGPVAWSADGKQIAYDSRGYIQVVSVSGGEPHRLQAPIPASDPFWSTDGRILFYRTLNRVWRVRIGAAEPVLNSVPSIRRIGRSADGKYLYYTQHLDTYFLCRAPIDGGAEEVVAKELFDPSFAISQKFVYFVSARDRSLQRILLSGEGPAESLGPVAAIADAQPAIQGLGMAVAPDDTSIIFVVPSAEEIDLHMTRGFR